MFSYLLGVNRDQRWDVGNMEADGEIDQTTEEINKN